MRIFSLVFPVLLLISSLAFAQPESSFKNCAQALAIKRAQHLFAKREMKPAWVGEDQAPIELENGNILHPRYLSADSAARRRIIVRNGLLIDQADRPFSTKGRKGHFGQLSLYVLSPSPSALYMSNEGFEGKFHHSSYLGGKPVAMAGTSQVDFGLLKVLTDRSGHYSPGRYHLLQFLLWLRENNANLDQAEIHGLFTEVGQGNWPVEAKAWLPLIDVLEEIRWGALETALENMHWVRSVLPVSPVTEVIIVELTQMMISTEATPSTFERVVKVLEGSKRNAFGNIPFFRTLQRDLGIEKFVELSNAMLTAVNFNTPLLEEWRAVVESIAIDELNLSRRHQLIAELSKPQYAELNRKIAWSAIEAQWRRPKRYGQRDPNEEDSNIILSGTE